MERNQEPKGTQKDWVCLNWVKKKMLLPVLQYILKYFFDPIFFVSALGPLIVGSNYFAQTITVTDVKELSANPWAYAIISFNIQYFVLIVVFVFFISETIVAGWQLMSRFSGNNLAKHFFNSVLSLIVAISFAVILLFTIHGFFKAFHEVDLHLYLKANEIPIFGTSLSWPPFGSVITQMRIAFSVYSILLTIWRTTTLPALIRDASSTPEVNSDME